LDILFDLDGTLTDPVLGITRCIQHALAGLGRAAPDLDSLRRCVGPPLQDSFAELLESEDEILLGEAIRLYRERFKPVGMFENSVYPDVPEGLATLRAQGHRLWVATSKPHVFAREIVEHFGLAGFFERVHGSELSGVNVDKGDLIRHVLAEEAISPEQAWMVGDRMHDVIGARRNGVEAIGVLWGYGSEEELRAAAPRRIVATMAELCEAIQAT
jgi:phosphoglycolate phosphatase